MSSLAVPHSTFSLGGSNSMPYAGDFDSVDTGEIVPMTLDFATILGSDTITGCSGSVNTYFGDDENAGMLPIAVASFSGSKVSQFLGPAFIVGVIYQWNASIITTAGAAYTRFGRFLCANPQAPSAITPAPPAGPVTAFPITTDTTISQPGNYVLKATGLTITVPSSWIFPLGFSITDDTGNVNPNDTITGAFARSPLVLENPYQSESFVWDASDQHFIII